MLEPESPAKLVAAASGEQKVAELAVDITEEKPGSTKKHKKSKKVKKEKKEKKKKADKSPSSKKKHKKEKKSSKQEDKNEKSPAPTTSSPKSPKKSKDKPPKEVISPAVFAPTVNSEVSAVPLAAKVRENDKKETNTKSNHRNGNSTRAHSRSPARRSNTDSRLTRIHSPPRRGHVESRRPASPRLSDSRRRDLSPARHSDNRKPYESPVRGRGSSNIHRRQRSSSKNRDRRPRDQTHSTSSQTRKEETRDGASSIRKLNTSSSRTDSGRNRKSNDMDTTDYIEEEEDEEKKIEELRRKRRELLEKFAVIVKPSDVKSPDEPMEIADEPAPLSSVRLQRMELIKMSLKELMERIFQSPRMILIQDVSTRLISFFHRLFQSRFSSKVESEGDFFDELKEKMTHIRNRENVAKILKQAEEDEKEEKARKLMGTKKKSTSFEALPKEEHAKIQLPVSQKQRRRK
uniref:Uncharacterized protein n=1 Tax=Ditylenchus dipsaci TaxID=166011 RepID=A0A915E7P2_9BILA